MDLKSFHKDLYLVRLEREFGFWRGGENKKMSACLTTIKELKVENKWKLAELKIQA